MADEWIHSREDAEGESLVLHTFIIMGLSTATATATRYSITNAAFFDFMHIMTHSLCSRAEQGHRSLGTVRKHICPGHQGSLERQPASQPKGWGWVKI